MKLCLLSKTFLISSPLSFFINLEFKNNSNSFVLKCSITHIHYGNCNLITFRKWRNNNSISSCNMLCRFFKCFTPTQSVQSNFPETLPRFPSIHVPPHFYKASYVPGLHHLSSVAKAGRLFLFLTDTWLCELVTMEIEYIDHWIENILPCDWIYLNIGLNTYFNIEYVFQLWIEYILGLDWIYFSKRLNTFHFIEYIFTRLNIATYGQPYEMQFYAQKFPYFVLCFFIFFCFKIWGQFCIIIRNL